MGRNRLLLAGGCNEYNYYAVNNTYDLSTNKLDTLISTQQMALSTFNAVTAVRLDFGLSKMLRGDVEYQHLMLNGDITTVFTKFLNRLKRKKGKGGSQFQYLMNWKVERSKQKGLHIHTVFYFDNTQVPIFTNNPRHCEAYKLIKELWLELTVGFGTHKLCNSALAYDDSQFNVHNGEKYTYTILSNDCALISLKGEYHCQKNRHTTTAGWFRWISYLAKDGEREGNTNQLASSVRKRMGKSQNLANNRLLLNKPLSPS